MVVMNHNNQLFEELLGDNASKLAADNNKKKDDGESTQMSSILGPILRDKEQTKNITNNGGLNNLNNLTGTTSRKNTAQNGSSRNKAPQRKSFTDKSTTSEEDTFMTKPREIDIDPNSDDVSALFGGGGASVLIGGGGVESYRGTYAKKRHPTKSTDRFSRNKRNVETDSRRTGATSTFQSHGINSILEEVGLRPSSSKKFEDFDTYNDTFAEEEETEDSGGPHHGNKGKGGRRANNKSSPASTRRVKRQSEGVSNNKMIIIITCFVFIIIQFSTVQRRDKKTMEHLNWRFNNHRYDTAGVEHVGNNMQNNDMQRMRNMAEQQQGRRRGAHDYGEHDNGDGLGDVLRKSVPLVGGQNKPNQGRRGYEREQVFHDDSLGGGGNLRGGKNGMNQQEDSNQIKLQMAQQKQQQQIQQQQAQIQQQQQQIQQQQQMQVQQQKMAVPKVQQVQQQQPIPPLIENLGDNHPLLPNQTALKSMSEQAAKMADKLSDVDPRPMQSLDGDIIPKRYQVFADLRSQYVPGRDTPFFWHIPRSGGVIVKTMLSHCLGQTIAAEVGEMNGHGSDSEIKVIRFADHNYTNVNIATPEGITRALNLGLVPSHLADTIVSAHVDLIPALFNGADRARAFVVFRNPIDRSASMFYFLKSTGYPPLANMTVDDYAKSELIENNWLVRILSESMTGPIDMDNLEVAKEVLRRKFIIGLLENKRGTFARFDHYFKWKDSPKYQKEFGCRKQLMDEKYIARHPIRKDSDTWKLLHEQNRFDMHLYEFAKELFTQQSFIFGL